MQEEENNVVYGLAEEELDWKILGVRSGAHS